MKSDKELAAGIKNALIAKLAGLSEKSTKKLLKSIEKSADKLAKKHAKLSQKEADRKSRKKSGAADTQAEASSSEAAGGKRKYTRRSPEATSADGLVADPQAPAVTGRKPRGTAKAGAQRGRKAGTAARTSKSSPALQADGTRRRPGRPPRVQAGEPQDNEAQADAQPVETTAENVTPSQSDSLE